MKSRFSTLFIIFLCILIMTACSSGAENTGGTDDTGESTTVKMIFWPGPESDAMQKVVDAYNNGQGKEDNVQVEMVLISRDGTYEREATMMSSESDEVDMYFTASYILGQHASALEPLDGKLPLDNYLDTVMESLKVEGETLAIPTDVANHFLFYRKDLIDELLSNDSWKNKYQEISEEVVGESLQPKSPDEWNLDDFVAAAAFFTKEINPESPTEYGTALQLKTLIMNVMIWNDLLWGNGGNWLDENGEPNLNSDAAKKAMNVYKHIYEEGMTSPNSTVAEFPETQAALNSGNAALAIQWGAGFAELNDPEKSPGVAGKIEVAPVPGQNTHVHGQGIGLNKNSKNKEAALKWMEYLTTTEAMEIYAQNGGIPAIAEVLDSMEEERPILPIIAEHVDKYGYSAPILPETYNIFEKLSVDLTPAWVGEEEIDVSLQNAQKSMETILNK